MNENVNGNAPIRQEFGASQMMTAGPETASMALAAQSKAMVEARYIMAMQRPRNWDQVRQDILAECRRPAFAHNKSSFYLKPIGKGVEGLGIRFVEVAMRCMTNMLIESSMQFEDDFKEIHRVSVTDLESNCTWPLDVRVAKTVERRKPASDGTYLTVRQNSYGATVYTLPGTDDELLNKRYAMISKAVRTLGLRLIPGGIQDEAEEIIKQIRKDKAASDPASERNSLADAFSGLGVKAAELLAYLGHDLDACSPAELVSLRALWGAIRDGEATWASAVANKEELDEQAKRTETAADKQARVKSAAKAAGKRTAGVAEKVAQAAQEAQGATEDSAPAVNLNSLAQRLDAAVTTEQLDEIEDIARALDKPDERMAFRIILEERRAAITA